MDVKLNFKIESKKEINEIECYTTRPDTLFGMSFLALSVDHPIAKFYENDPEFIKFKKNAQKLAQQKSLLQQLINLVLKLIY